jgi:hypothetical protein
MIHIEFKEFVSVNGIDGFKDTRMRAFDCRGDTQHSWCHNHTIIIWQPYVT